MTDKKENVATAKVILDEPIQFTDEVIKEITFKKPTAADMRKMSLTPTVGDFLDLAQRLGNVYPRVIEQLSFSDTWSVVGALANFTPSGPATGPTS